MALFFKFFLAIGFLSSLAFVQSDGELLVLNSPKNEDQKVQLTCISDDSESALVWNTNDNKAEFEPKSSTQQKTSEGCAIWNSTICLTKWQSTEKWQVVNSAIKPMGPALDYRWEDFGEFVCNERLEHERYQSVGRVSGPIGTTVFSARGSKDVHILICDNENPRKGFCFWTIIAGYKGQKSILRRCDSGAPSDEVPPVPGLCPDMKTATHDANEIINEDEWRTFTIKLNGGGKRIEIFRESSTRIEQIPFLEGNTTEWRTLSHVFLRCNTGTRVRFHFYDYYFTESVNASMRTDSFSYSEENSCLNILVGVCPKCGLNFYLADEEKRNPILLKNIRGTENSIVYNETMTWQSVRLNIPSDMTSRNVQIIIRSIGERDEGDVGWAIDDFRLCNSNKIPRKSTILTGNGETKVYCQKLSYNESTLVDGFSENLITSHTQESQNYIQQLEDLCGSSCFHSGEESRLCASSGCTCKVGFGGSDCNEECSRDSYGFNCNNKCACCPDQPCSRIDGTCQAGVSSRNRRPPFCNGEFEKPRVMNITDTSVIILQNITMNEDTGFTFEVVIKDLSGGSKPIIRILEKSEVSSIDRANVKSLENNTLYQVQTYVSQEQPYPISGATYFMTTCSDEPLFALVPENQSITVTKRDHSAICTGWLSDVFDLLIDPPDHENVKKASFPYKLKGLKPYTKYQVDFIKGGLFFLDLKTRTDESAPSKVQSLKIESTNTTGVNLSWLPPLQENGIIRSYNVTVKSIALLGCNDTGQPTPVHVTMEQSLNETMASFNDLHPYAEYAVTVVANTIVSGEEETIMFSTKATDIPTSVVSDLHVNGTKSHLEWKAPANCTTITGPSQTTKLVFTGESERVRNWKFTDQTNYRFYALLDKEFLPFTKYAVRAYVIRYYDANENVDFYANTSWTTPPSSPPAVQELQIYDADFHGGTTSLRWKPPNPANGIIESYTVLITDQHNVTYRSETIKVPDDRLNCELWEDYVCLTNFTVPSYISYPALVEVYAKNNDVKDDGEKQSLKVTKNLLREAPSAPTNFKSINKSHGIVTLKWNRPEISATKISLFYIRIDFLSTGLFGNRIKKPPYSAKCLVYLNTTEYYVDLSLLPSTVYNFTITSSNSANVNSTKVIDLITTNGSVGFNSTAKLNVQQVETLLVIKSLTVLNATVNTTISVIMYGATACSSNNSRLLSSPEKKKWVAAVYKFTEITDEPFKIGANHHHGVDSNCSLYMGETYKIFLMVTDLDSGSSANSTSSQITLIINVDPGNSNLAWLILLIIIPLCVLLFFIQYRRRKRSSESEDTILNSDEATDAWNRLQVSTPSLRESDSNNPVPTQSTPDVIPYNPGSCAIEIEEFEEYTKEALASGLLEEQYTKFTRGLMKPCDYGKLPENASKNRYKDLIAYDETRVVLDKIPGDPYSDYINASYIPGYRNDKAYIATQGPKPNTVNDFWRMIWQKEVQVICMLANVIEGGRTKCEHYWPDIGTKQEYGKILIWNIEHQVYVDYTFRRFVLKYKKQEREVMHLHYTGWPDHGVPMYTQSLVPYLKKILETDTGNGPIVVHCSAGVGRTGTIILCDTCLRQAKEEKVVDLPAVTVRMRKARANMVDNVQQYLLAHLVIVESMVVDETKIPCKDLQEKLKELRERLPSDIKRLNDTVWQDRALHALAAPKRPVLEGELIKNGTSDLTSENSNDQLSYKQPEETYEPDSKYVKTVRINGMKLKNQYISSRLLSPSKRSNFWKLIADEHVELIIILQRPDPDDPTCCDIIPDDESPYNPVPHIKIERKGSPYDEDEHFTIDKFLLTDESDEEVTPQPVTVLTCNGWGSGKEGKPPPAAALVSLWRTSEKISRQESPTFVFCQDGVTGCGLYLALSFLLEHMAVELQCDVISSVRAVRRFKPEFVQSLEQFEYLYDAAVNYEKCFQTYANFA